MYVHNLSSYHAHKPTNKQIILRLAGDNKQNNEKRTLSMYSNKQHISNLMPWILALQKPLFTAHNTHIRYAYLRLCYEQPYTAGSINQSINNQHLRLIRPQSIWLYTVLAYEIWCNACIIDCYILPMSCQWSDFYTILYTFSLTTIPWRDYLFVIWKKQAVNASTLESSGDHHHQRQSRTAKKHIKPPIQTITSEPEHRA